MIKDLLKKIKLPKIKIKRENFVVAGLVVIALAIPLTVAAAGIRQELRKRAAPATGSILINGGASATSSRDVTLTLTAPTSQASLIKPNFKIPQAHAAGCTLTANPNPCTVQQGQVACTSTISWTTDDDLYLYVYSTPHPEGQLFSYYGAGSYTQDATWITCTDTFTFVGVGVNDGIEKCRLNVTGQCAAPPTPTPTPTTPPRVTPTLTPTPTPTTTPGSCTDTDGGLNLNQRGTCSGTNFTKTDSCGANNRIFEVWCCNNNYCTQGECLGDWYNCPTGTTCQNGACVSSTPTPTPTTPPGVTPTPTPTPAPTIVRMRVSNYSNFSGAGEEIFTSTKSWTLLPGADGVRTVYAMFKWSDGTWTQRVEDSINLVTVGPTPTPTPTLPPGVTPTPTPTTPPGVTPTPTATPTPTPTPTPPEGEPTAYLDKIIVQCHPWQLTYSRFSVTAWGHSNTGGEVAFAFTLSKAGYNYTAQSGLVPAQGAGQHGTEVGYWIYFQNDVNQLFHWPETCCRKGDYTLTAYAATVERDSVTGEIRKTSDWSAPVTATVTVYTPPGDPYGHVTCNPTEEGEIEVEKPVISNLNHTITGDTGHSGYANIRVNFNTDIESDCKVYWSQWDGTGYSSEVAGGMTTGVSHSSTNTEYYSAADPSSYRYQAYCAKKGYYHLPDAKVHKDGYFTLPSSGGGGGAPPLGAKEADLNDSGDVDIGDWGSLVDDYGQEGEGLPADFNGNGEVDILDVSKFRDAYRRYAK